MELQVPRGYLLDYSYKLLPTAACRRIKQDVTDPSSALMTQTAEQPHTSAHHPSIN